MLIFLSRISKYYGRSCLLFLIVLLSLWAIIGWLQHGKVTYPIVALANFILTGIVASGFLVLRALRVTKAYVEYLITYLFAFLFLPVIWLILSHYGILGYAIIISKCCQSNVFLNNNLWGDLHQMRNGYMADAMSHGLVAYASLILLFRYWAQPVFKWIAVAIGSINLVLMIGMIYSAYFEPWSS